MNPVAARAHFDQQNASARDYLDASHIDLSDTDVKLACVAVINWFCAQYIASNLHEADMGTQWYAALMGMAEVFDET